MLLHACRQLYRSHRLSAVCFRALAASAECSVGYCEEVTEGKGTNAKDDSFIDKVRVRATGGIGGAGCDSYIKRSRKGIVRPRPDGGHGGRGGDVVVEACSSIRDLRDVRFIQRAGAGGPGGSQRRSGVSGQDRIITVPIGTCISRSGQLLEQATNESLSSIGGDSFGHGASRALPCDGAAQHLTIADLDAAAARILVAQGGPGGRGSMSAYRLGDAARSEARQGRSGEEVLLQLELKLLADVGFVGMPNVGKSTLLRALTNAKPKVANYPFTTLQPQLGILEYGQSQIILADIPGLIAGAAQNRGRGFAFLRHVERTRMLAYVLDLSSKPGPTPLQQLANLQTEVEQYSPDLPQKTTMIVGNKVDQVGEESQGLKDRLEAATGMPVHFVSARYGQGLSCVREALAGLMSKSRDL